MNDTPAPTTIGDRLGFTHADTCDYGDNGLLINEKYVGNEGHYIMGLEPDGDRDENGDGPFTLTLSGDSIYDEVEEGLATTVECRYCTGTPVPIDTDEYEPIEYR